MGSLARALNAAGAKAPSNEEIFSFFVAVRHEEKEKIHAFVKKYPQHINMQDTIGYTPLMWAVSYGDMKTTHYLLEKGADVNIRNIYGSTALMLSAVDGNYLVTRMLVDRKADLNVQNDKKETALHKAAEQGHDTAARVLLSQDDCNLELKDNTGKTAAQIAKDKGHDNVWSAITDALPAWAARAAEKNREKELLSREDVLANGVMPQLMPKIRIRFKNPPGVP